MTHPLPGPLAALVQVVGAGLVVVAADGEILAANRSFLRAFGLPAGPALTGQRAGDVPGPAGAFLAGRLDEPGRRHRCPLPDGRLVEGTWHRLPDGDRPPLLAGTVAESRDDARVRSRLRQHNRALAELVATKTELVSAMLHELRTPLAAARSMAELLPGSTGDPLVDEALAAITRNLDRIADVTTEIATVSGIENGTIDLAAVPLDLPELLARVADEVRAALPGTPVAVTLAPAAGTIVGDRDRLAEAFERLSTAVHAVGPDPSGIRINAAVRDGQWQVSLPMAPQGAADQLFTATGERSNATALMLARAVVARHGGTVGIESPDGTPCLTVRLPVS